MLGVIAWAAAEDGYTPVEWVILLLIALIAILFSTLTVEVASGAVRARFGPGWIRRTIMLSEIESATAVRLPWYVGWGMRWWGFWLYNVSGRMAIVLRLRGGRRFGIGTDEPEALLAALRRVGVTTGVRS